MAGQCDFGMQRADLAEIHCSFHRPCIAAAGMFARSIVLDAKAQHRGPVFMTHRQFHQHGLHRRVRCAVADLRGRQSCDRAFGLAGQFIELLVGVFDRGKRSRRCRQGSQRAARRRNGRIHARIDAGCGRSRAAVTQRTTQCQHQSLEIVGESFRIDGGACGCGEIRFQESAGTRQGFFQQLRITERFGIRQCLPKLGRGVHHRLGQLAGAILTLR